jgi:hypothetical protein
MVMRGIVSEPWGELVYRMVKLCLLYIAATTAAYPISRSIPSANRLDQLRARRQIYFLIARSRTIPGEL